MPPTKQLIYEKSDSIFGGVRHILRDMRPDHLQHELALLGEPHRVRIHMQPHGAFLRRASWGDRRPLRA